MSCGNHIGQFPCCSVINADNSIFTGEFAHGGLPCDCVIITDPPYGIAHPCDFKTRKQTWAGQAKRSDYDDIAGDDRPFDPTPILALDVPTVIWGANYFSSKLPDTSGWLVWDKNRPDDLDQATCELAWTNFVKGVRRLKFTWNGMIRASKDTLIHPTQKPVELTRWILSNFGSERHKWTPAGPVIDLYAGSGSALVAAKQMGRHYLGFELSKDYCERAEQWLLNPFSKQSKNDSDAVPTLW